MFSDIAQHLAHSNRSRLELRSFNDDSFKIHKVHEDPSDDSCSC